ncbi:leucine-rich repeat-containing protein 4-like [Limulus polyphemus]|uniref:Leucine-rich repeat-containing protein 4-like n=1 Tax=Limulus polyphemus TaxID=6850 RepID=A0ABM1S280_LIMPO|nr:leucine-rich repeat-containing protein 4-like [Limulus polyphemus]
MKVSIHTLENSFLRSLVVVFFLPLVAGQCPTDLDIAPCTCLENEMTCDSITAPQDLQNALQEVKQLDLKKFFLTNSNIPALPSSLFNYSDFQHIIVEKTDLPFLTSPVSGISPFMGIIGIITQVELREVKSLNSWDWTLFSPLKTLRTLIISECSFVFIPNTFSDLTKTNIQELTIKNSDVWWIGDSALSTLNQLHTLNLSGNKIKTILRSMFPSSIKQLHLMGNELKSLPEDIFKGMNKLILLDLTYNKLETLSLSLFPEFAQNVSPLEVKVEGNPWVCNCSIVWLSNTDYVDVYDIDTTTCASPDSLVNKILNDVDWASLGCQVLTTS